MISQKCCRFPKVNYGSMFQPHTVFKSAKLICTLYVYTYCYILYVLQDLSFIKILNVWFSDTQANWDPLITYDGTPFLILGKTVLECHQGPDKDQKTNKKNLQQCWKNVCIEYYCCNLWTKKS